MTPQQRGLLTGILHTVLNAVLYQLIWRMPRWLQAVAGVSVFGVLWYLASE